MLFVLFNIHTIFIYSKEQKYRANLEFIDSINRVQSSWKAVKYDHYEGFRLGDMYLMAGGPKSKIAG